MSEYDCCDEPNCGECDYFLEVINIIDDVEEEEEEDNG